MAPHRLAGMVQISRGYSERTGGLSSKCPPTFADHVPQTSLTAQDRSFGRHVCIDSWQAIYPARISTSCDTSHPVGGELSTSTRSETSRKLFWKFSSAIFRPG